MLWGVFNRNLDTGEEVLLIQCPQKWVAELMCQSANESFTSTGRNHRSHVKRL